VGPTISSRCRRSRCATIRKPGLNGAILATRAGYQRAVRPPAPPVLPAAVCQTIRTGCRRLGSAAVLLRRGPQERRRIPTGAVLESVAVRWQRDVAAPVGPTAQSCLPPRR